MNLHVHYEKVIPVIVPVEDGLKSINFYIVKHGQSLSLIDAGMNNKACWDALISTLQKHGWSLTNLTEIILTHHHIDHIGLVNAIVAKHPIPVYASPISLPRLKRDQAFLEMRMEFYAKLYEEMGCGEVGKQRVAFLRKSIEENRNQAIEAAVHEITEKRLFQFDILEYPGHAPDQLAFYHRQQKSLFAGDLLIQHISSNALVEPDDFGNRLPTLSQHVQSLKRCNDLKLEVVYSGHGELIHQPYELIKKRLDGIEEKSERFLNMIQSGITTANELAQTYYKKRYSPLFQLVMSEIIGHLDYLEVKGKVEKVLVQGVWHYYAKQNK
ncbi:MBL fold metallo-hydrolase [Bacillus marasmi]|uniref:MBL fold metallo-hydrolase n=1 Tax=Bacillus marasmi TaxID=1926279 RepID=UPI001FE28093|nr:MBL fold metallo-hydrolase [Bacillus marasmi]